MFSFTYSKALRSLRAEHRARAMHKYMSLSKVVERKEAPLWIGQREDRIKAASFTGLADGIVLPTGPCGQSREGDAQKASGSSRLYRGYSRTSPLTLSTFLRAIVAHPLQQK